MESNRYKYGFTLVEMLVVVAVIMLLAGLTIGVGSHLDTQSKERTVKSTFELLATALQEYYDFAGGFPEPNVADDTVVKRCEKLYRELYYLPGSRDILEQISGRLVRNEIEPTSVPEIYDPWDTVLDYTYVDGDAFPELRSAGPSRIFYDGDDITSR